MYERRSEPLLPARLFMSRMLRHGVWVLVLFVAALGTGVIGYRLTEGLPWIDSLLNASMILSGMGPVDLLHTSAGKLFASAYALFAGIAFLATAALIAVPIAHRLFHALHMEAPERTDDAKD